MSKLVSILCRGPGVLAALRNPPVYRGSLRRLYKGASLRSSQNDPKFDPKACSNEEWAKRLSPESYFCTREGGTEAAFTGKFLKHTEEGIYSCVCCENELFSSKSKYDSGSGWPSFNDELKNEEKKDYGILRRKDVSHGMVRIEALCKKCNGHLGHVFEDGPAPEGLRFSINSASLKFKPKKLS